MTEHELQNRIRLYVSEHGLGTIFRANAGTGWTGNHVERYADHVTIYDPRKFHGLPSGFPDLFGFHAITITPDMVGKRIAVFTAVEVKGPRGKVRDDQKKMIDFMASNGVRVGVARTIDEAVRILSGSDYNEK